MDFWLHLSPVESQYQGKQPQYHVSTFVKQFINLFKKILTEHLLCARIYATCKQDKCVVPDLTWLTFNQRNNKQICFFFLK